jgi:hypothetical protein
MDSLDGGRRQQGDEVWKEAAQLLLIWIPLNMNLVFLFLIFYYFPL